MQKIYTRKVSFNDRIYIAGDGVNPPVYNQIFLEGQGNIDTGRLRRAVQEASEKNPGSRLILKGYLGASKWVDSFVPPPVTEIDAGSWDGLSPEGAPGLLNETVCLRKGPGCDVVIFRGETTRLLFRTHHAVMDGAGSFNWMEDIFRVLRGEPPIGAFSTLTDYELARSYQKEEMVPFPHNNLAPTGTAEGNEKGTTWIRREVHGKYNHFLGQLAILAAKEAWKRRPGKFIISVPADMRHRAMDERSTGNLVFPIYVEITKDSTPEKIAQDVKLQLCEGREAMIEKTDALITQMPLWMIQAIWKKSIQKCHKRGLYRTSGLISNLGRLPVEKYMYDDFKTEKIWSIPPSYGHIPFFIVVFGAGKNISLTCSMPKVLASNNRIEKFMDEIISGLKESR